MLDDPSQLKRISRRQIQDFVYVDHRSDVAVVGTLPEAHGEDLIAIGRYYLDPATNRAEVAFVVRDDFQGRGIGTFLMAHLTKVARRQGIRGFTAEVLLENRAMRAVFDASGCKVKSRLAGNVYSYVLDFD